MYCNVASVNVRLKGLSLPCANGTAEAGRCGSVLYALTGSEERSTLSNLTNSWCI